PAFAAANFRWLRLQPTDAALQLLSGRPCHDGYRAKSVVLSRSQPPGRLLAYRRVGHTDNDTPCARPPPIRCHSRAPLQGVVGALVELPNFLAVEAFLADLEGGAD